MKIADLINRTKVVKPVADTTAPKADPPPAKTNVLDMLKAKQPANPSPAPANNNTPSRMDILNQLAAGRSFMPKLDDAMRAELGDNAALFDQLQPVLQAMASQIYVHAMNDALNAVPNMVSSQVRSSTPAMALEQAIREDDVLGQEGIQRYALQIASDLVSQNTGLTTSQAVANTRKVLETFGSKASGIDLDEARTQKEQAAQAATAAKSSTSQTVSTQADGTTVKSGPVEDWATDWFDLDPGSDISQADVA